MLVLQAQTAADESLSFGITNANQQIKITVNGLTGTEKALMETYNEVTSAFVPYYINGSQPYFDALNNVIIIEEPGQVRVNKPVTANLVGVSIDSPSHINIF